jgi:hypothetical protein
MSEILPVYIGYDPREHAAYMVCESSLKSPIRGGQTFSSPLVLSTRQLRRNGDFDRPWRVDSAGQFHDERDGKPFSTEFSHSRFLVPYLASKGRPAGKRGWALFVDCDFMFLEDACGLMEIADPAYACMVVQHPWLLVVEGEKMDNQVQQLYRRKLWSSLVLWNLDHPANEPLISNPELVNRMSGAELHAFSWLADDQIGRLPFEWNWIPGLTDKLPECEPKAIHWSFGGPWMDGFEHSPYADEWRERLSLLVERCLVLKNLRPLMPVL